MTRNERIRKATLDDVPAIIALLADDPIGRQREITGLPLHPDYVTAFRAIDADPNQLLVILESDREIIGCLQLSFIPGLSRRGMWRGQIEGVRIASTKRRGGRGRRLFEWAIELCRSRSCGLIQLTTDKGRPEAASFYESLGFAATHTGYKLALDR